MCKETQILGTSAATGAGQRPPSVPLPSPPAYGPLPPSSGASSRKPGATCATQLAISTSTTSQQVLLWLSSPLGAPASQVRPKSSPKNVYNGAMGHISSVHLLHLVVPLSSWHRNQRQTWWSALHPALDVSPGHQGNPRASAGLALRLHALMPSPHIRASTTEAGRTQWLLSRSLEST